MARNPTFFSLMLGDVDIMEYALSGGTSGAIPPASGANGVGFDGTLDCYLVGFNSFRRPKEGLLPFRM